MADDDLTTGKSPAFQFYPNDFLSDANVIGMSLQERGAYITLLCLCWQQGALPADVSRLARLCGAPVTAFRRLWPALEPCFRVDSDRPDRLIHPRLEREREKQAAFRRRQSDKGKASAAHRKATEGQPESNHGSTTVESRLESGSVSVQPEANSSSSVFGLQSSPSGKSVPPPADARSKRPIFTGQRFKVFEWQLDDLRRMLGPHFDDFDMHEWFFRLDAESERAGIVVPQRDGGAWLQAQTQQEAIRRGLPVASVASNPKTAGNVAAAARFVARGATA